MSNPEKLLRTLLYIELFSIANVYFYLMLTPQTCVFISPNQGNYKRTNCVFVPDKLRLATITLIDMILMEFLRRNFKSHVHVNIDLH